jgi:hypothetical protein
MTDHSKATPRPWKYTVTIEPIKSGTRVIHRVLDNNNIAICEVTGLRDQAIKANIIVEAVNNHDRLFEENKRLREALAGLVLSLETNASKDAYSSGLGVSEWEAFIPLHSHDAFMAARAALEG